MKRIVMAASLFLGCMSFSSAWAAVDLTLFEQDFLRGHQAGLIISNGGKKVSSAE
ncbi:MAG: hypothetical protein ACL93V_16385 [Candidatus Electrothrix sp. YB6]